jgi:hypothetical protein
MKCPIRYCAHDDWMSKYDGQYKCVCGMNADLFLCNEALRKVIPESSEWDYWAACLNPMCEHGKGEGYSQSKPDWVINKHVSG